MNNKMITCKICGKEIAKSAKTCPHCGAKNVVFHPFLGLIAVILSIPFVLVVFNGVNKTSVHNGPPEYQDVLKIFSQLYESSEVSVREKNDRLSVIITCNDLGSAVVPENWENTIDDFKKALFDGNELAKKYGFRILSAEIVANDGTIIASGGDGECTFNKFETINGTGSASEITDVISVSSRSLWSAYEENRVNADAQYKDKLLSVTGTIVEITQDLVTKAPCVMLDGGDELGLYHVSCFFPKNYDHMDDIANLRDGMSITIIGTCDGVPIYDVQLTNCYLPN